MAAKIHMSEVDQEFVSDIFSLLLVTFKSFVWRWPGHLDLILKLQGLEEQRVSVIEMRALFPGSTHVSTLIPIQPRPTVERVKLVECIEPGNRSLISTPAFYAPLPYRTEHCYYCPLLMTLSGLRERTWVSIVSYYRGFEPISRVIIKESTKPEPHRYRRPIDSREEAVARCASVDELRSMERICNGKSPSIRPILSFREPQICIDSDRGHRTVELLDLYTEPTAIESRLTKQYDRQRHMMQQMSDLRASVSNLRSETDDKQCHIMRQLSDLHASVSDLRACVQQQVPEIDRVC